MQLPNTLLASLRVGLGATVLLGSACATTSASRGPDAFPGLQSRGEQQATPVMVAVPVADTAPVQPIATPDATPPDRWESCEACGRG